MPGAVPGISEIPAGTWEMRSDDEAQENYHRVFGQWLGGALDLTVPGALAGRDVVDRYLTALLPMLGVAQRTGSDLAVVSHGAVIRLIAGFLGRVDPDYAVRTLLPNTSRVELEVPELATLPTLPTSDAPTVDTAAVLEGWRVTDWAGHGEPPRRS
jgi:probable phosphoglycerate mutase